MNRALRLHELLRYASGGLLCAIFNNCVFLGLSLFFHLGYAEAFVLAFAIAMPLAYAFHTRVTFNGTVAWRKFGRFAAGMLTTFALSFMFMALLCSWLKLSSMIAMPLVTGMIFALNYLMARRAILLGR